MYYEGGAVSTSCHTCGVPIFTPFQINAFNRPAEAVTTGAPEIPKFISNKSVGEPVVVVAETPVTEYTLLFSAKALPKLTVADTPVTKAIFRVCLPSAMANSANDEEAIDIGYSGFSGIVTALALSTVSTSLVISLNFCL